MQPCACKESRHLLGVSSREKPQFPTNSHQAQDGVTTEALQAQFEHYGRVGPQNRLYCHILHQWIIRKHIHRVCKTWRILYCLKVKNVNINQNKNMKGAWTLLQSHFTILKNYFNVSAQVQWFNGPEAFCFACFSHASTLCPMNNPSPPARNLRRRTLELPSWSLHVGMMPERQCRPWWLQRHPHRCLNFLFVAVWKAPPLIQQMNQGSYIMFSQPGLFI